MILKTNEPMTANGILLDRTISHAHYLERLKAGEVRKIVTLLNRDVLPDLLDRVSSRLERIKSRGLDAYVQSMTSYRELLGGLRDILDAGMRRLRDLAAESLVEVGEAEIDWQARAMQQAAGRAIVFDFEMPSVSTLRSIVSSRPMHGRVLGDWFEDLGRTTRKRIEQQISIGIASGESVDEMVRRLRGTREARYTDGALQTTRNGAEAVVRTAVNHVSTHAREELFLENDDLVKGVQIVATLDLRTTDRCKSEDGRVYRVGEGPRPPFHVGCRTTVVPVIKSWKDLGINLKEAPEGTRASMDGQVPASTTYAAWLARQSAARQDMALGGPGRGALYRRGQLTIDRFIDAQGRPLSLRALKELEDREAA